ncbi:MAG: hypothetical protein US60_C0022G0021 [Microgenomates group bacterium GW2011_GWC1_37_8]|uniref:Nudix hydrolase domain-containing protein n=2 Tax=Candidatus Woeseibacteriota TaxID=1752722 RepID=A0A0G0LCL9_9BACT|nr:MAG: hypothetical protein US60_C0022G0021 [Microgenomates group bacterium GW2011_GWC1_37_8]KKQ85620.1 MAG: hypothetical protein UT08_C0005G0071 [Candidatus Woesebacteria bacterium GW2011_GWB1_38_8]OGM21645.1 MAG: hypothetical protein A2863_02750 [Candidatus Woesebacteria bacterium RIFCSPHIGHO2_01_FULL_38_9b]
MNKNFVLISCACVFNEKHGKQKWFLVKLDEDKWEIPKMVVRKGESSVRAGLRMMTEKGGMNVRVLEEVGRAGGVTSVNDKTFPQRYIYYLMLNKMIGGEVIGFSDFLWLEHAKAVRKLTSKRERQMLKIAKQVLIKWQKERKKKYKQTIVE